MEIKLSNRTILIAGVGLVSIIVVLTMGRVVPLLTNMIIDSDLEN